MLVLITIIIIGFYLILGWHSIHELRAATITEKRLEAVKALSMIQAYISSERGAANLALSLVTPKDKNKAAYYFLIAIKTQTDESIKKATIIADDLSRITPANSDIRNALQSIKIAKDNPFVDKQIISAINNIQSNFITPYKKMSDEIESNFRSGEFTLDGIMFRQKSQLLYRPIIELQDLAYQMAKNEVEDQHSYIKKYITADILAAVVTLIMLYTIFIVTVRKLSTIAMYDSLTGLPNRILLEDRLRIAISKAVRNESKFALMFMDIDNFKTVNDACGHHVGDGLIKSTLKRVRSVLRAHDTVARISGDEFVMFFDIKAPSDASVIAKKIISAIDMPQQINSYDLSITASIGIAIFPDDATNQHDLLVNADMAMYHAKSRGKNRSCFYEPMMATDARSQLTMQNDLHTALARSEFELYYQPKFFTTDGRLCGAEALIRWNHPRLGLVFPDQFIALAEKIGLIIPIGNWVLNRVCQQLAEWKQGVLAEIVISVNLSPLQFVHPGLTEDIALALQKFDIPASNLTLEITETTAMHKIETSIAIIDKIKKLGINISIDDFGTGHSSLFYLKQFAADELKIDRGFIINMESDPYDIAIISAIIQLGKRLDMQVVAEGIENSQQQEILTQLGCDIIQGYHTGKPVPADLFYNNWAK